MRNIPVVILLIWMMLMGPPGVSLAFSPAAFYSPYPQVLSPAIQDLPGGFDTITLGPETFYYSNGIFYQKIVRDGKYAVVPPPIGAVVFRIPEGFKYMLVDGTAYYEYGGVYYQRVLEGYRVIYPPVIV